MNSHVRFECSVAVLRDSSGPVARAWLYTVLAALSSSYQQTNDVNVNL